MIEEELLSEARAYVQEVWDDVERDIDWLVQVDSVEDLEQAEPGMPFGPGPREALDRALAIAGRLGLEPHNCDGYVGFGELAGESERYVATIGHADIVPVGTGWSFEPLRLTSKDGYLIGRGVLDDKGPLVLSLYAAHFLARKVAKTGERLPRTLRCIVGSNEETGMRDVDYYLNRYPQPDFCFTPDAEFPAICGEKGRVCVELVSALCAPRDARIVRLKGGAATNAVVGRAKAVVVAPIDGLPACEGIEAHEVGCDEWGRPLVELVALGAGGHAAMPEDTRSAVGMLCAYLLENGVCTDDERAFLELEIKVFADTMGKALGIDATDEVFDPLTSAGTMVVTREETDGFRLVQTLDIRYPTSTTCDQIMDRLSVVAKAHGCEAVLVASSMPFLTSPDAPEVQTLLGAYRDVFRREGKAFTIGGGTYARHFDKAVACGPLSSDDAQSPAWIGPEHGANEGVRRESMQRALETYVVALSRLMER